MRRRRLAPALATAAATAVLALAPAAWAAPEVPADKPQVLSRFTQTSAASYRAWADAREHPDAWTAYGFDWSTDQCTSSPDNPFGFPFAAACARHDFGYRHHRAAGLFRLPHHRAAGLFPAAKARLDAAFHADLKRVCAQYAGTRRNSCDGTAWTYYQAVRLLGIS